MVRQRCCQCGKANIRAKLSEPEVIVEEFIICIIGFMRSSFLISDFLEKLYRYPEVISKIVSEQKLVSTEFGNHITAEALEKSRYLNASLKETLRFQAGFISWRYCHEDVIFHDGLVIPKDSYVMVSQVSFHFNDECYPESKKFKPERWLDDENERDSTNTEKQKVPNHFTFGAARHICPGRYWVYLCAEFIIALYFRNLDFDSHSHHLKISPKNSSLLA